MKILFICTHNRCRSILAEAVTNHLGTGKIQAASAGSAPVQEVHPLSLRYLTENGIDNSYLQSQSWADMQHFAADIVITVCDSAAAEACPLWMGNDAKAHWGLPDPSRLEGTEEEVRQAFYNVMSTIALRINALLALDTNDLNETLKDTLALQRLCQNIAEEIPYPV